MDSGKRLGRRAAETIVALLAICVQIDSLGGRSLLSSWTDGGLEQTWLCSGLDKQN